MDSSLRRRLLGAAIAMLAASFATAQQRARPWRIAFLSNGTVQTAGDQLDAFVLGLREHGWAEGHHFVVESRWAEGKLDRLPALVADLMGQKPDLIYAPSGIAAQATKDSGTSLPIVFAFAPDPVGQGFGATLARPGRNMTGLTSTHTELSAKRIEILREAFPGVRRIGVLYFRALSAAQVLEQVEETERAAKILGITVFTEESPKPDDFERAFASIQRQAPDALIVIENPMFYNNRVRICELAATLRVPAVYNVSEWARAGGLLSYGASYRDLSRRAAAYAVKVLNGAAPGDLPIERPTKLDLVINLKTARAMGLSIPPAMLARADDVIQ